MRPCWRIDGNLEQNAFKVTHRSPTKIVRRDNRKQRVNKRSCGMRNTTLWPNSRLSGNCKKRSPKPPIPDEISAPGYIILITSSSSGAELLVLNDSSRGLSKEHSFYSCGSLVLHVWKYMSISVQREGRAGVSELLRNNFRRHSGCQRNCGRRVAQIVEPYSWHRREVEY